MGLFLRAGAFSVHVVLCVNGLLCATFSTSPKQNMWTQTRETPRGTCYSTPTCTSRSRRTSDPCCIQQQWHSRSHAVQPVSLSVDSAPSALGWQINLLSPKLFSYCGQFVLTADYLLDCGTFSRRVCECERVCVLLFVWDDDSPIGWARTHSPRVVKNTEYLLNLLLLLVRINYYNNDLPGISVYIC